MASISLHDVTVEFPIYQSGGRSLKRVLLDAGTGGRLGRDRSNRVLVRALSNLTVDIAHGERIGLIGGNGAGKTTLLRVISGIYEPAHGEVAVSGQVSPLLDVGLGLNMEASGYENIFLRGLYMGMRPSEIREHAREIIDFTELGDYAAMPVRTYSAGMLLRLSFAVATCANPEILVMDEWVLAGDAHFLGKARRRLEMFIDRSSILVLATHTESLLEEWCTKLILLDRGSLIAVGSPKDMIRLYHERAAEKAALQPTPA